MPNRIIKESICTSERLAELTDFEFRLWVGLITQADDAGRGDARPAIIKGRVFPLRERVTVKDVSAALHALAAKGCVSLYTVDEKPYFWFPSWAEHQRVRDCKPKYPAPNDGKMTPCGNPPQSAAKRGLNPIQSEYESESNPRENAPAHAKERFGDFKNVLLTPEEYASLREKIPDADSRIAAFSAKLKAKGYTYDDHYAAILLWYEEDRKKNGGSGGSFDVDEFFEAALRKTYGEAAYGV